MQKNYSKYQYETSPRKIKPDYAPTKKNSNKQKKTTTSAKGKNTVKNKEEKNKKQKNRKIKTVAVIVGVFAIIFAIAYRNAEIDENFSKVQDLKEELALVQKENEQVEVEIESNLNLNNLENEAREQLGMTKITNKQMIYVDLPKGDYIESGTEKIVLEEENWLKNVWHIVTNLWK